MFAAATTAKSHSPARKALHASWKATNPDEHAVLIAIAGPVKSKK